MDAGMRATLNEVDGRGFSETTGESRLRVFDLHCDTLDRLCLSADPSVPGGFYEHDRDVPRARMSRLDDNDAHVCLKHMDGFDWCQCFAVFVPDEVRGEAAWSIFKRVRDYWKSELLRCSGSLEQVAGPQGTERAFSEGKSAGILTVEGLSFLEDDGTARSRIAEMAASGVRMATLTWNGENAIGSGSDTDRGLAPFGRAVVGALESAGIVVDASHLNDAGFRDLLNVAERPFACSHSNARAVCGHPRNLEDWQLREIAVRGGVVGLNYFNGFLTDAGREAAPDDVLRHADRILSVAGEDALALGSDYDGSDVPAWLDPCDKVADLHALLAREFGGDIAGKALWGNAARFFGSFEAR